MENKNEIDLKIRDPPSLFQGNAEKTPMKLIVDKTYYKII